MLPWLSPATTRDKRRVEHSSNDLAEQTRAGTGGDVIYLPAPFRQGRRGEFGHSYVSLVWGAGTWARCCQKLSGTQSCGRWGNCHLEVVLGIAVMGLPVPQHRPTPTKECCSSAAEQQEEKARAALHGIAASTTAGAVRVTEM